MRLVFRTVTLVLATAFAAEVVAAQDVPVPPGVVPGQTPGQAGIERGLWSNITVGGSTEVFSEMYRVAGRDPRRPGETARLNLRPQINFGRAFTVGADILLSTEGSSFGASGRQRVNRLGLNPTWSWGSAHIGDFSDALSPLTYEGIPVRGGAVKLEPGLLRFAVLGGVTQRAIAGDASNGSFGRRLFAGRLGIGQSEASYADVVML